MQKQIHPGVFAAVIVAVLVVIGVIVYFSNRGPSTSGTPATLPAPAATGTSTAGMSPDQQVQMHLRQSGQGAQGGQGSPGGQ